MKIVQTGSKFKIYSDDLLVLDDLKVGTYKVGFNQMEGFYLTKSEDLSSKEDKIYGEHQKKLDKVMKTYQSMSGRSLGVILSGGKGIGKSMFANMLSEAASGIKVPTIIVSENYPGIEDFIESICQEVVVLFDEFEKVFDNRNDEQDKLLGLFDGMSSQKRLYVITCNKIGGLSEYILNRPGRFHYHIRFENPSKSEIVEYLTDKLGKEHSVEIARVADFGMKLSLNYDMLRAIAFDLSQGYDFAESMKDLNIMNTSTDYYQVKLVSKDHDIIASSSHERINLFVNSAHLDLPGDMACVSDSYVEVIIDPSRSYADERHPGTFVIDSKYVSVKQDSEDTPEVAEVLSNAYVIIKLINDSSNNLRFLGV